ncbi:MAG TPA: hypothetical protein VFB45_15450 [Pseudolabrys sp.]|nr:hypothetical protein [Pseudolabrys sp.]
MATNGNMFRPKVKAGSIGERKDVNGAFKNIPSYPQFGGFSSSAKMRATQNPSMALEKSPTAQKGKPI